MLSGTSSVSTLVIRKLITTEINRGMKDLKAYVTDDQFVHISTFPHMKSEMEVAEFTKWVEKLGVKQVQGKTLNFTLNKIFF
jgi:polyisoprenoid-binding protein YceI